MACGTSEKNEQRSNIQNGTFSAVAEQLEPTALPCCYTITDRRLIYNRRIDMKLVHSLRNSLNRDGAKAA
jgi:hypothetical protein